MKSWDYLNSIDRKNVYFDKEKLQNKHNALVNIIKDIEKVYDIANSKQKEKDIEMEI